MCTHRDLDRSLFDLSRSLCVCENVNMHVQATALDRIFRTKSIEWMMLNTRDTPKTPRSTSMPISFTSAAPARPRQITSTTDRAFGRSSPALLEADTLPAVQATALDRIFRTKSIERMMLNTRDTPKTPRSTPKTPRSTPMPISFTSAAPARPRQITSTTDRAFGSARRSSKPLCCLQFKLRRLIGYSEQSLSNG